jgi:hypothetical protein
MHLIGLDAAASGVCLVSFDYTNIALMAFRTGTATPAGTVAQLRLLVLLLLQLLQEQQ